VSSATSRAGVGWSGLERLVRLWLLKLPSLQALPAPGPNEILMRVRARSLNYRDVMVLKSGGRGPTKIGVAPLSDGAGEVAAIGEEVTRVKIGDRITGCFHPRWFGGAIKPDYLTDRLGAPLATPAAGTSTDTVPPTLGCAPEPLWTASTANASGNGIVRLVLRTGILKSRPKPWTFWLANHMPGARIELALSRGRTRRRVNRLP
jgi:Alcohol dehydrogenase GroES-like domain